jgi:hypothetical protein
MFSRWIVTNITSACGTLHYQPFEGMHRMNRKKSQLLKGKSDVFSDYDQCFFSKRKIRPETH